MGGRRHACARCRSRHFAFHSCNHKACPRCGAAATAAWVARELDKRVNAPYFIVTFTLPEELRSCFFGSFAKEAYDLFFAAASAALTEKLASAKGFHAAASGFTAVLHTWGQQMQFHPHIHCLVPGAGINAKGKVATVRKADYLVKVQLLQGAFRQHFRKRFHELGWQTDPAVWRKPWGVHIQPAGAGACAVKYLGNYVCRSVISDSRMAALGPGHVTFKWRDRANAAGARKIPREKTLPGSEFIARYLRHVLPRGLRSIRYYGFCHPSAKRNRAKIKMHTGSAVFIGPRPAPPAQQSAPACPRCGQAMRFTGKLPRLPGSRAPPDGSGVLYFA